MHVIVQTTVTKKSSGGKSEDIIICNKMSWNTLWIWEGHTRLYMPFDADEVVFEQSSAEDVINQTNLACGSCWAVVQLWAG